MDKNSKYITLSQLQSRVKSILEGEFALPLWVVAEISEVKVNYSGHCYLEFVEKGGRNQVPKAKMSGVIWRSSYGAISSYFQTSTGRELEVGMQILMRVSLNYHELYGMTLVVSDIDPLYTMGDMEQQRLKVIAQLKEEGVFDMNKLLEITRFIQRIAIVSSPNAAGYQDFMNELGASGYTFKTTLFDSFMQGNGAEESIINALEAIVEREDEFDAIVIIRGGGSQSDLSCFNSYRLSAHVAQMPLPVIAGIGHDKDQSIVDMVAKVSVKTPTAVASFLVELMTRAEDQLLEMQQKLYNLVTMALNDHSKRLMNYSVGLYNICTSTTRNMEQKLYSLSSELQRSHMSCIAKREVQLERYFTSIDRSMERIFNRERSRLNISEERVNSCNPKKILSLGFAMIKSRNSVIKDVNDVSIGDNLDIILRDGSLKVSVKGKK